nr:hypothetical transcript [Hymenolepis microstoma]
MHQDDQGRDQQPRVGYQNERIDPPVARNHNGNSSFNFQVGEDVRIDAYTPETSYAPSGPPPNIRIQGATIRSDNSNYLSNETPRGGVALDDTLETGI